MRGDKDFKQIIGVKKETYKAMIEILEKAYAEKYKRRGRHLRSNFLSLKYWHQYITQKELAFEFEVGEARVHDVIVWVEDTLVKGGDFSLPGKKALCEDRKIEIVIVDVTESSVESEKNNVSGIQEKRRNIQ